MICEAEKLKTSEFVKRRILRLQQVREQSKDLAKKIRGRVKDERGKVLSDINKEKEREVERVKQRNIEHLKSQLEEGLAQVGAGHSAAIFEDLINKEWDVTKKLNRNTAIQRGNKAAQVLHKNKQKTERHCCVRKSKSPQKLQTDEPVEVPNTIQQNTEEIENAGQTKADTQSQPEPIPEIIPYVFNTVGGGEHVDTLVKGYASDGKKNHVVNERGDGDFHRDNVITANYFEVSPNRECNDTLRKFYPTETIRQLQLSEQPPSGSTRQSIRDPVSDRSAYYRQQTAANLHGMSKNNPFSTVISDHIKNRRLKTKRPHLTEALPDETSEDMSALRSIIQHTRHAPPLAPSIPQLPAGYRKTDEEPPQNINAGIRKSELTPATSTWLPSNRNDATKAQSSNCNCKSDLTDKRLPPTRHDALKAQSSNCNCVTCFGTSKRASKTRCKPTLRQMLKSQHNPRRLNSSSSVTNAPRFVPNKCVIRCKPAVPSIRITTKSKSSEPAESTARDRHCQYSDLPKHIRTYDEMSKTERTSVPDSNYMVERMSRDGKSAFELAREETMEAERRGCERREYFNDQARRVRGQQAADKLQKEKEYRDVIQAIENYEKEQRRVGKKLPDEAFMSEHRMKQKHQQDQRKMEKAYETAERQTKVHVYPGPITAPVVQPERRSARARGKDCYSDVSSDEDKREKRKSPLKKRPTRDQSSVVNVAEWNPAPKTRDDDLDEIPTRDSDSTVKSVTVAKSVEVMDVARVVKLIEKQREQLLKEVARMEQLKRNKERKSPRKKKQPVVEVQTNSTTDEAACVVEKAKSPKRRSPSPKVKKVNQSNTVTVKRVDSNQQLSSGSQQSSVSFQGFQIVVEVKKSGKSSEKKETVIKAERSVQTTKSLLENQDSSEVSVHTAQVVTTEKVTFQNDDPKSRSIVDSSGSTSYMSPPDRFSRRAVETYFGKRLTVKTSETQTDVQTHNRGTTTKQSSDNGERVKMMWMRKQQFEGEPQGVNVFFNTESTINGDDNFVRNKERRNVRECVRSTQPTASTSDRQHSKKVLQPSNQNVVSRSGVNPKLKKYIHQLLEASHSGVNIVEIDVSDIPTPTSSIVNVPSNTAPALKGEYKEKVEKLKLFIDENYSLLEQLEKERLFHKSYSKNVKRDSKRNDRMLQRPEVSSSVNSLQTSEDLLEDKENRPKKSKTRMKHPKQIGILRRNKKHKHKKDSVESSDSTPAEPSNKCVRVVDTDEQDVAFSSDIPNRNSSKFVPVKNNVNLGTNIQSRSPKHVLKDASIPSDRTSPRREKTFEEQEKAIEHYKRMSEECNQRIQNLTKMLDQVRKDKQMTLSSNSSPSSDDLQSFAPKATSSAHDFVPILSNIPRPKPQYPESTRNEIPVKVWDFDPQLSGIQVPPLNLNVFEQQSTPGKRPRPPAAMNRHADAIPYNPHELSTIVEVETPGPGRNTSSTSKQTTPISTNKSLQRSRYDDGFVDNQLRKTTPGQPSKELSGSCKKLHLSGFDHETTDVNISPFVSFKEFVREYGLEGMDELLGDSTIKAGIAALDLTSESEETLPDVVSEMVKRNLIQQRSRNNSSRNGSGENSSTDSAIYILQTSSTSPEKKSDVSKKVISRKDCPNLRSQDVASISGIDKILQTSDSSSVSENLMCEFNKALENMGIPWAVSTLKKTKETMELSSSSSSRCPAYNEEDMEVCSLFPDSPNAHANSMFRKYAEDLSNSSINKQMDELFRQVSKIKKSCVSPKKSRCVSPKARATADNERQKSCMPVKCWAKSGHSSSEYLPSHASASSPKKSNKKASVCQDRDKTKKGNETPKKCASPRCVSPNNAQQKTCMPATCGAKSAHNSSVASHPSTPKKSTVCREHIASNEDDDIKFYTLQQVSHDTYADSPCKKNDQDLPKSNINSEVDKLLNRVAEIKKSIETPKKTNKPCVRANLFAENAQQKTSTPVKCCPKTAQNSSMKSPKKSSKKANTSSARQECTKENANNEDEDMKFYTMQQVTHDSHDLSSTINSQMDKLLERVSEMKKSIESPKQCLSPTRANLFAESAQQRTSTPVKCCTKSSHSSSAASAVSRRSSGLFSNESDLSSVKNVSQPEKNCSVDDTMRDSLDVPSMFLTVKFKKMFDSTAD